MAEQSSMTSVEVIVVDDSEEDRQTVVRNLDRADQALEITELGPLPGVEDTSAEVTRLAASGPSVVFLDYRLDESQEVGFKGGSLAAALRDVDPGIPICLLTTEEKLQDWVATRPGIEQLFDWQLLKERALKEDHREAVAREARSLALGFREVSETKGNDPWKKLLTVTAAQSSWLRAIEESGETIPLAGAELARWILWGPIRWNGPLLDSDAAKVVLGITSSSFASDRVQNWIEPVSYRGVFSSLGDRWWAAALRDLLREGANGQDLAPTSERAAVLRQATGGRPKTENCVWCGGELTIRACQLCKRAVDGAHSLRMGSIGSPEWAEAPVVCFACIEDGTAEEVTFAQSARDIVERIRAGEIQRPEQDG